ncbi:hypothetical protein KCU81_g8135, partial [Aureobasidium melanogenum]|uniref:Cryptic loci regulator 2 N-terminal domain-containing protein n=1 Tax=Aureobasidium melanogenum (strain CBS 110374) TaxID=1043003 RepID=A0A074WFC3_AURM1
MAQSAPTNIDLSSLWSDGTGQTPNGAEFSQILRGTDRYNEYLEYVTRGCNRNAQMAAQYGHIKLTGDLPQGYTLWLQDNGGKKTVLWLYGHPRGNFRSALNFSDHIPEMLAANDARERRVRAEVKATNDEKAREDIKQNNKDALLYNAVFGDQFKQYNEDEQLHVSPYTFLTEQQANDAVLADPLSQIHFSMHKQFSYSHAELEHRAPNDPSSARGLSHPVSKTFCLYTEHEHQSMIIRASLHHSHYRLETRDQSQQSRT